MVKKIKRIKDLLSEVVKENCFEQRSHTGQLSNLWKELFGTEFGTLIKRNGDILIVKVSGAPMRSELENFKKWEILEVLHLHEEFASIRDIRFVEN